MANPFTPAHLTKSRTDCCATHFVEKATLESDQSAGKTAHPALEMMALTVENPILMDEVQVTSTSVIIVRSTVDFGIQSVERAFTTSAAAFVHLIAYMV